MIIGSLAYRWQPPERGTVAGRIYEARANARRSCVTPVGIVHLRPRQQSSSRTRYVFVALGAGFILLRYGFFGPG